MWPLSDGLSMVGHTTSSSRGCSCGGYARSWRPSQAEVGATDVLVTEQLLAAADQRHAPVLQHVTAAGESPRLARVLLDQQHGRAGAIDLADGVEDLLDDQLGQTERGLVQPQELCQRHDHAADRQHLLFAARQRPGRLGHALAQAWKEREDPLEAVGPPGLRRPRVGAELEVLAHGEAGKDLAAL